MPNGSTKTELSLVGERAPSSIYDEVFLSCTDGYCIFDADGILTSYSSTYPDLYPTLKNDIHVGLSYKDYIRLFGERAAVQNLPPIDDLNEWVAEQMQVIEDTEYSYTHHLHDGRWMNIKFTRASSGQWLFIAFDITAVVEQKNALNKSRKLFKSFAALSSDWYWELDAELRYVHHSEHKISPSGLNGKEMLGHERIATLSTEVVHNQQFNLHNTQLNNHEPVNAVLEWNTGDGSFFQIHVVAEPHFHNGIFTGYLGCGRDVSEEYLLKEQLNHLASHDDLTKLLNRRAFETTLSDVSREVQQKYTTFTLCFIDLDRFKLVNDGGGHEAGDELLRLVAQLFSKHVATHECLARLGGDEFAMIMHVDVTQALARIDKVISAIQSLSFIWQERKYTIGASAGLVGIDSATTDISDLLSRADAACYDAKHAGRNQARVYLYDEYYQNPQAVEITQLNVLRAAMDNDELLLYLQPLKSLSPSIGADKPLDRFEVLLRLIGSDGKPISAGTFIPVAEKYDLMQKLDAWVVEQSLKRLTALHERGIHVSFSINLSGNTLSCTKCLENCEKLLQEYCTQPELVCFEITETAAIKNLDDALHFIQIIKSYGCKFALDDFGAGMSSFGYLKSLPLDYLKIDGAFVKAMTTDPTCKAIVSAFNKLSHELGMKTVAEFVENETTENLLRDMGVDYVQGYGIGKPCPFDQWDSLFEDGSVVRLQA